MIVHKLIVGVPDDCEELEPYVSVTLGTPVCSKVHFSTHKLPSFIEFVLPSCLVSHRE